MYILVYIRDKRLDEVLIDGGAMVDLISDRVCSLLFAKPLPSRTAAVFYFTLSRPQLTESNRGTPLSCSPVNRPAANRVKREIRKTKEREKGKRKEPVQKHLYISPDPKQSSAPPEEA